MEIGPSANEELAAGIARGHPLRAVTTKWRRKVPDWALGPFPFFPFFLTSLPPGRRIQPNIAFADTRLSRQCGMYQPPPLRCSVFDDKKVLVIDPQQRARDVRASVLRSRGVEVDAADNLQAARSLWRSHDYDLILLDPRGHLPGEALDFYREIKHASPRDRIVFLVEPPTYLSLTWPTEFMAVEMEPQQWAETVKRLFNAA